jgi:hypothetical protein
MNDHPANERELRAELAELRAALRELRPQPADEAPLRAAFRARQQRLAAATATAAAGPAHAGREWRPYLAAAAVVALVVAAVVIGLGRRNVEQPSPAVPVVAANAALEARGATAFQPLMYAPGFSPSAAYSVVRVRIPLSSFAVVQGTAVDGTVEADLLVGEDGIARGIRFNQADTLRVSAVAE